MMARMLVIDGCEYGSEVNGVDGEGGVEDGGDGHCEVGAQVGGDGKVE